MAAITKDLVDGLITYDQTYGGQCLEVTMSSLQLLDPLPTLTEVSKLTTINLSVNMFTEIPKILSMCISLRVIDLSVNHISEISNLHGCQCLLELNLSKNQIARIRGLE